MGLTFISPPNLSERARNWTYSLAGAYPNDHAVDDDWETVASVAHDDEDDTSSGISDPPSTYGVRYRNPAVASSLVRELHVSCASAGIEPSLWSGRMMLIVSG